MLPKGRRLTSDYEFKKVRQRGKKIRTPFFDLYYLSTKDKSPSRFGFVVSTKLDKRAVRRNRVKRIFREQVRELLSKINNGFDLVFWIRQKALGSSSVQVRAVLKEALRKGGLMTDG